MAIRYLSLCSVSSLLLFLCCCCSISVVSCSMRLCFAAILIDVYMCVSFKETCASKSRLLCFSRGTWRSSSRSSRQGEDKNKQFDQMKEDLPHWDQVALSQLRTGYCPLSRVTLHPRLGPPSGTPPRRSRSAGSAAPRTPSATY